MLAWAIKKRRAQSSLEYLLVVAFALLMVIPITLIFFLQSQDMNEQFSTSQADVIARKIVENAEMVYYIGEPSQITLEVYMPPKISSILIGNREVNLKVETRSGISEVVKVSKVNITGSLVKDSGIRYIKIQSYRDAVNVSDIT